MLNKKDESMKTEAETGAYLETRLNDAGFAFAHNVANVFFASSEFLGLYKQTQNPKYLASVQSTMNEFYSRIDEFKESLQPKFIKPKGEITPQNLECFDAYRCIDFTQENVEETEKTISEITSLINWLKS